MMNKRKIQGSDLENIHTLANCLMLFSGGGGGGGPDFNRVFECKTCNRQFPSFQALGGHRASHKKQRLTAAGDDQREASPPKPKTHECSICGVEFPTGQALGGHMRRHRPATAANCRNLDLFSLSPIVEKSISKRVLFLDLNLTPSENKFLFGKVAPAVDCFF